MIQPFRNRRILAALSSNGVASTPRWLTGGIPASWCIAAYEAKGAASLAASYVNLANPGTYDLTLGSAPTWNATDGWIFNGTKFLKTGIIASDLTYSVIYKYDNNTTSGTGRDFGAYSGATNQRTLQVASLNGGVQRFYGYGTNYTTKSSGLNSGIIALCGMSAYFNGIADGTIISSGAPSNLGCYVGATNFDGNAGNMTKCNMQYLYVYNADISSYIVPLTAAMAAL